MLDAVRSPLVLGNLAEDCGALVEQLVHDTVLRRLLQVLEGVLGGDRQYMRASTNKVS